MSRMRNTTKSKECFERAKRLLVGGVASSAHKAAYQEYPIYVDHGKGSRLYDVDGNEYIDYFGAFGPAILGFCPSAVGEAVKEQIDKGSQYAAPFEMLNELSKKLIDVIPCADLVSYQSTGTEANLVEFRVARAYTGKTKIIKFEGHYHGWADELMISSASDSLKLMGPRNRPWKVYSSAGQREKTAEDVMILPWNDLELVRKTVKRHGHEIAAIITEPIMCNCEPVLPKPGYLEGLREIATENEIVLIFDEVITGFRLSLGGAEEYFKITPDMCSFAKAVAGGFQLAGVAGKRAIMESDVHPLGTFNANPIGVAAAMATIRELEKPGVYEHMARITQKLTEGVREIAKKRKVTLFCEGVESIWYILFGVTERLNDFRDNFKVDKVRYQRFREECLQRGVWFHPFRGRFYTSAAHTDADVDQTLSVVDEALSEMSD